MRSNKRSEILAKISDHEATKFYNSRYFIINMHMLRLIGLWPHQNKIAKFVIRVIISTIFIISMIPQIIGAVMLRKIIPRLIQSVGTMFYLLGILAKFISMLTAEKKMTMLYRAMVKNWNILDNQAEKEILVKHSENGRLLTIGYLTYMFGALILFISLPVAPRMINMITPMFNDSLIEMFILDGEYLVDKQEYYYYIYFFETFTCLMTVPLFSTIDSTYALCVEQCVGLLAVIKLRLQLSTRHPQQVQLIGYKAKDAAYGAIAKAAALHEEVYNYGRILESSYSTNFFFVLAFNTAILTTTSVCILFNLDNPVILLRYVLFLIGLTIHLFYLSWPGQKVIDGSNDIFYATYDNEWYECSVESQQLLKFMMHRTIEPLYLTSGGFYIMNFENFEMLMKTALSYITVLSSFK